MPPSLRPLLTRWLSVLILTVIAVQAVPSGAVGFERGHGSAFDVTTLDVATGPEQHPAEREDGQRVEPPPPPPPLAFADGPADTPLARPHRAAPPQTGPPGGVPPIAIALAPRPLTGHALAPRAPPPA